MSEKNNLQSFYRPLTKEWSDVVDADFAKNTFATNPYEYRFANNPAVEKFLKDTFGEVGHTPTKTIHGSKTRL